MPSAPRGRRPKASWTLPTWRKGLPTPATLGGRVPPFFVCALCGASPVGIRGFYRQSAKVGIKDTPLP